MRLESFGIKMSYDEITEQKHQRMYEWLLLKYPLKSKRQKKLREHFKIPKKKHINIEDKLRVLFLRYGDIVARSSIQMSIKDVALKVHYSYQCIQRFLMMHKKYGKIDFQTGARPDNNRKKNYIPDSIKRLVVSKSNLIEYAPLSVRDRVEKIESDHGFRMSKTTLSNLYKRNNIVLKTSSYAFHRNGKNPFELEAMKRVYLRKLLAYLYEGRTVIFMDETSTHR
jgi:hypothetical protein